MTPTELIKQIQENAQEWLEMSDNPSEMMMGIMAKHILNLKNHIEYLEKRINHDSRTASPF